MKPKVLMFSFVTSAVREKGKRDGARHVRNESGLSSPGADGRSA